MSLLEENLERILHESSEEAQESRESDLEGNVKSALVDIQNQLELGQEAIILEVVYRLSPEMYGEMYGSNTREPDAHDPNFIIGNYFVILGKDGVRREVKVGKGEFNFKRKPLPIEEYLKSHLDDFSCEVENPTDLAKGILSYVKSGTPHISILNYWNPEDTK